MRTTVDFSAGGVTETHWKSLHYFNLYRFVVAGLLFTSSFLHPSLYSILSFDQGLLHLAVTSFYLLAATGSLTLMRRYPRRFNMQLSANVLVDVLVITLLIHTGGGLRSGLGVMLLVTLTGSGLVGQGRLVLFYAALATLAVLFEQSHRALNSDFDAGGFFQAGVFSAGFFAVAISARLLARRVIANEELARQRGVDLANQMLISQRVIEEMQDGVLVLNQNGWVKQHNPHAERLLGLSGAPEAMLSSYSPELAKGFLDWRERATDDPILVRVPMSGMQLSARFVTTESSERDVLVYLEDMGRLQAQAQQLKLAALGRLTANIAHEIRNPLSAISHAGELMLEERRDELHERLLRIVLDNAQRLERIVSDVLELGRRDRAHRELIDLRYSLPIFVEEYAVKEKVAAEVIQLEFSGTAMLCFDRSHFHQVMWNLLSNALRHSRRVAGSVRLLARPGGPGGPIELHVIDDGAGVSDAQREQIFEPFFTTHNRGTGLGLYIARELCETNGARLELQHSVAGADFCIAGRSDKCQ
jgi:two-component system sensor histidine kinase PilS (NtrC family)